MKYGLWPSIFTLWFLMGGVGQIFGEQDNSACARHTRLDSLKYQSAYAGTILLFNGRFDDEYNSKVVLEDSDGHQAPLSVDSYMVGHFGPPSGLNVKLPSLAPTGNYKVFLYCGSWTHRSYETQKLALSLRAGDGPSRLSLVIYKIRPEQTHPGDTVAVFTGFPDGSVVSELIYPDQKTIPVPVLINRWGNMVLEIPKEAPSGHGRLKMFYRSPTGTTAESEVSLDVGKTYSRSVLNEPIALMVILLIGIFTFLGWLLYRNIWITLSLAGYILAAVWIFSLLHWVIGFVVYTPGNSFWTEVHIIILYMVTVTVGMILAAATHWLIHRKRAAGARLSDGGLLLVFELILFLILAVGTIKFILTGGDSRIIS